MSKTSAIVPVERIESRILLVRGHKVLLDSDLAQLYGVTTKRLNEQVKRNQERFRGFHVSADFLRDEEFEVANCDLKTRKRGAPLSALRIYRTRRHHGRDRPEQP
jgi:hypothetical protein